MTGTWCGGSVENGHCDHAACGWEDCRVCVGVGWVSEDGPVVECPRCEGHGSTPKPRVVV